MMNINLGKPDIKWLRNGVEIKSSEDFRYENAGAVYKLVIAEVFPEDSGTYMVFASTAAGKAISACTVQVTDEDSKAPIITSFPQSANVEEGNSIKLLCSVSSQDGVKGFILGCIRTLTPSFLKIRPELCLVECLRA
ncbi:hypothetical protein LOTGIDRAFT_163163 [Lottia gigantea]|uniref:Immunoglobulin I-set domain-containing protein n=1 Tax=Lottia gigantea TaxID=225164 RepID=V3ZKF0_LOTGI|nr:hypothetical protein LOTGIDRAFT_163163 [Lottia gigantea]ESO91803.1 hypothetical protein LOTGIDRAFT_163163 [Lottia gigantea]